MHTSLILKPVQQIVTETILDFVLYKLPDCSVVRYNLSYSANSLETWHRLDRERISQSSDLLLENSFVIYFKCPSVKRDILFVLLLFMRKKYWLHRVFCRTSQSLRSSFFRSKKTSSTPRVKPETSQGNQSFLIQGIWPGKFFVWQAERSVLQFSFRELLFKIGIALQIY
jgi:hypothetical protein